ncbi:MAG: alpha-hydroxy-acid oxidizing protein [Alphaproteobacteria bacterium]|nr:alpha-hydroxy-acid oxidizing protein [Alphaproteobacteria bacterium]
MPRLASPHVINIADLRALARKRLPNAAFDYLDGAAEDEVTAKDNIAAFSEVVFKPRQAVMTNPDLATRLLGVDLAVPFLLSPIGYSRMLHPRGELAGAGGAARIGTGYILSTISGHPLERVREQNDKVFFQVYLMGGREATKRAFARAKALGYKGLFVTIDTAVAGMRERDHRNGMGPLMARALLPKLRYLPEIMRHPRWLARFLLDGGMPALPNVVTDTGPLQATDVGRALENAHVCWEDLKWIREAWDGPVVIKGVMGPEDALRAVDEGADGIVVSNHAGRQLDGVAGSLRVLPAIVEKVKGKTSIIFDGGIRRGGDIAKAICMGADACLVGRAYAYGMAAAGDAGVDRALEILIADLKRTMKLLGANTVKELSPDLVHLKPGFRVD